MRAQNIRFGELETKVLFSLEEAEAGLVTSSELAQILKIPGNRANKLAWQLARKNRLIRIRKGVYLFAPLKAGPKGNWSEESLALVSQLLKDEPYCISFWTAFNYHGLTEQVPLVTQAAVLHRRRSFLYLGSKLEFIKVKRLGEWQEEKIAGRTVKTATIEQSLIDGLSHPEYCGGMSEVCKALWEARKRIDKKKLEAMALNSKDAVRRRLGFLLELLGLPPLKIKCKFIGLRWLDSSGAKEVKEKSAKWGLLLNLTEKQLTYWKES